MSIVSIDQIKRKLRWGDIVPENGVQTFNGREYSSCLLRVQPSDRAWPSIDLHFDGDMRTLDPLGFSHWHGHYDRWSDERRNLIEALRTARRLVEGKICLVEELGTAGDYRGGSLLTPDTVPSTISKDVRQFRRVFFNKAPNFEEIDFRRYWEGKHLLVEWRTKEETEKIWREHGIPIEW